MAAVHPPAVYGQAQNAECLLYGLTLYGPYEEHVGTYHLRLYVTFIQHPDSAEWITQQEADASAAVTFQVLNAAYNQHGIYFVNPGSPCSAPTAKRITTSESEADTVRDVMPGAKHDDGIDIYVFEDRDTSVSGSTFEIPSVYFSVRGLDDGLLANETTVAVHEVGHLLGLLHIHEDECDLSGPCPGGYNSCNCTGDYICDTAPTTSPLPCATSALARNYMSYSDILSCRDHFTDEQVLRMRTHLASHDSLQNIIMPPVEFPGGTLPTGPSGNILVESGELHITSTLEMLPGAYIWVKPGATLRVSAKITGACGKMWRGVIVQGVSQDAQTPALQGRVIVNNNGIIEHAECGIEAWLVGADGKPVQYTGGCIVNVTGGKFLNNTTGIRFGPYAGPNVSYISYGDFYTDEDYRGGSAVPTHLELNDIAGLRIDACEFKDLRTACAFPDSRATGIQSFDASFRVGSLCRFENLFRGIHTNNLEESPGSFTAHNNRFEGCYIGIRTESTSDFSIEGNDFHVKVLDSCEAVDAIGAYLNGTTVGFSFKNNYFHYDETDIPEDSLIGVECASLGEGLNNQIKSNVYDNMIIAHRAWGDNGFSMDGLVYLCDSVTISYSYIPSSVEIKDFQVKPGGVIREDQEDVSDQGQPLPTGNVFSGFGVGSYSFQNLGATVNYLYYDGSDRQNPENADLDPVGINPEASDNENTNCFAGSEPCAPPCDEEHLDQLKDDFHEKKGRWQEHKAAYPSIEDEEEQAAVLDSITFLRQAMNRDARLILMTHSLDTAGVRVDSILAWLELAETYPTDYRRARHYFFTGKFSQFDSLWAAIPERYELDEAQLDDFDEIETVLDIIRPGLEEGGALLSQLPEATLDSLMYWKNGCTEPGALAQAVLWRNGRRIIPDCSGEASRAGGEPTVAAEEAEEAQPSPVRLFPNPSRGTLTLELPAGYGPAILVFYNLQGKLVLKQSFPEGRHTIHWPKERFRPGLYLAEIAFSSGQRERFKLILTQ